MTLENGATRDVDLVVLATGYQSGLEDLLDAPSTMRNIHFVGYHNSITGLLRQIGVEAELAARAIANQAPEGGARTTNY